MKRKNENTNSKPSNSNSAKESEDFLKELDVFAEADESSEEQAASEANREDEQILEEVREIGIREPAEEETAEKVDEDENQKELLRFFLTGKKPGALKDLLPA
ncbi:MAG: hypothetical protein GWN13_16310, partial [Phycisphaerae bacterium]|nr:hypothetical protein [Phycisphaerae bacterium]